MIRVTLAGGRRVVFTGVVAWMVDNNGDLWVFGTQEVPDALRTRCLPAGEWLEVQRVAGQPRKTTVKTR